MKIGLRRLALTSCMLLAGFHEAHASCPSSHLEPTLNYGHAFGNPVKITTDIDIGQGFRGEEAIFTYVEYLSRESRETGYSPVFAVHVFRDELTKNARVVEGRLKADKPILVQAPLSAQTAELVIAIAAPIVRDTHYPESPCPAFYLDGYVIDVGVNWRTGQDANFIGGSAYSPIEGTPAGHLQVLGHALRAIATGKLAESKLETALREKGIVVPQQ